MPNAHILSDKSKTKKFDFKTFLLFFLKIKYKLKNYRNIQKGEKHQSENSHHIVYFENRNKLIQIKYKKKNKKNF